MSSPEAGRKTFQTRLNEMVDQLRRGMSSGMYPPGTYLPPEKALAKQFGLSSKSVRKGLEQLLSEGCIDKIPRVGSLVKELPRVEHIATETTTLMLGCQSNDERTLKLSLLLEDFQQLNPHIRVESVPLHLHISFMKTMRPCLDNELIDVFTVKDGQMTEIAEAGYTQALAPQKPSAQAYPFLHDAFRLDGRLLARPLVFTPLVLAYNVRHFREAGVMEPDSSWTWNDAIGYAAQLIVPGQRYGLCFQTFLDERWPVFLLQSSQAREAWGHGNSEGKLEGIRLSKSIMYNPHIFPSYLLETEHDVGTLFIKGLVSMIVTSYYSLNRFAGEQLEYNISPLPFLHSPVTLMSSIGVAVNAMSKRSKEAQQLVDYLTSSRAQQLIRDHTVSPPASKPIAEAPPLQRIALNRPDRFQLFRDIMPGYRRFADLQLSHTEFRSLRELFKAYWSDMIDEETLSAEADVIIGGVASYR